MSPATHNTACARLLALRATLDAAMAYGRAPRIDVGTRIPPQLLKRIQP